MSIAGRGALFIVLVACVAAIVLRRPSASTSNDDWVSSDKGEIPALDRLEKSGVDLSKPTEINYYLYFSDSVTAAKAADSARAAKWEAEVLRGRSGWTCQATKTMVLERAAILDATMRVSAIATSLGGTYNRWEVAITR